MDGENYLKLSEFIANIHHAFDAYIYELYTYYNEFKKFFLSECRGAGGGFDILKISLQFQRSCCGSGDWHVVLCKLTKEIQIFRLFLSFSSTATKYKTEPPTNGVLWEHMFRSALQQTKNWSPLW